METPGWLAQAPLLLTVVLTPEAGGTRVTLTHSGFENLPEAIRSKEYVSYQRGWSSGGTVAALKRTTEEEAA